MDPITLSLLMAGGQALLPAIKSMKQGQRLKDLPDATRPDFQIPKAATEALDISRSITGNRNMPGYDEALDKIENQTNRTIGDVKAAGGNMQDIMAAMASANVGAGMAKRDLDITNAKSYLGTLQNLQGQLGSYANWQNAQQQDEMKAYNDEMARRAALDTARQQNMQNAVGSVGQGVATGIGYQMNMNMLNKLYPGVTPPVTPPATLPGATPPANLTTPNPSVVASLPGTAPATTVNPVAQPTTNTTNLPVNSATTPQVASQMPFTDFSQVTKDQFVNADLINNPDLFGKITDNLVEKGDILGISPTKDNDKDRLGKYYDWLISNQGAITPQMPEYSIMEGVYNMYKK